MRFSLTVLLTFAAAFSMADVDAAEQFKINGKPVPDIVATVNGTNITAEFLKNKMFMWRMESRQKGEQITPELEEKFARAVITQAIEKELLYQKGKELNVKVEPETIRQELENIQSKFPDQQKFLMALAFQRLSLNQLEEKIEKELIEDEVTRLEIAPHVDVPDSAVEAYYNRYRDSFIEPKKYKVSQIFVGKINTKTQGRAEDSESQKKADRMIEIVNGEARDKIEMIHRKLKDGADFVELVRQYSEDEFSKPRDGDIGEIYAHQTVPAFAAVISRMKVGEISDIVEYDDGFHIFQLNHVNPEKPIPLENMKTDIMNALLREEVKKKKREYVAELKKTADIKIFL
ncbi:MAG: peptidylprolyl isomerase [Nitrospinales bacterium]